VDILVSLLHYCLPFSVNKRQKTMSCDIATIGPRFRSVLLCIIYSSFDSFTFTFAVNSHPTFSISKVCVWPDLQHSKKTRPDFLLISFWFYFLTFYLRDFYFLTAFCRLNWPSRASIFVEQLSSLYSATDWQTWFFVFLYFVYYFLYLKWKPYFDHPLMSETLLLTGRCYKPDWEAGDWLWLGC